jgi:hypothetical protein
VTSFVDLPSDWAEQRRLLEPDMTRA